jgi:protein-tyrosine-phosphatase
MSGQPLEVLFVCTANSVCSPLAEGLMRAKFPGHAYASAGAEGSGRLHPLIAEVVAEFGGDLSDFSSRALGEVAFQNARIVVALSAEAMAALPEQVGPPRVLHWPLPDPLALPGDRTENVRTLAWKLWERLDELR